jgi:hypothetical protein
VNPRGVEDGRADLLAQESELNSIGYDSVNLREGEPANLSLGRVLVRLPTRRGSVS